MPVPFGGGLPFDAQIFFGVPGGEPPIWAISKSPSTIGVEAVPKKFWTTL